MHLISRKVIQASDGKSAPLCAGALYIHDASPVLLRRTGREISDDMHDDYRDEISRDNGHHWETPQLRSQWNRAEVEGGFVLHSENAFFYEAARGTLWHFTNRLFQPNLSGHNGNHSSQICITSGTPEAALSGEGAQTFATNFGFEQGVSVSFCCPCLDSRGNLIVPFYRQKDDADGSWRARGFAARSDMPHVLLDVFDCAVLIGEEDGQGGRKWTAGEAVPFDDESTTRGLSECAIEELRDGRLVMIARGSNAGRPDLPGYKWLSTSQDGGRTWSRSVPLACDDGTLLESSATGCNLFRSHVDGQLYWIGNLCLQGERARGNWPRSPLVIAKVQEEPFALVRDSIFVVDRAPDDNPYVQHSNFKFYQDRETGDVVIYLPRYGERGTENNAWLDADLHEYRVSVL